MILHPILIISFIVFPFFPLIIITIMLRLLINPVLNFFFFIVTVTSAVSWEEWWTYDGISGKLTSDIIYVL